MEDNCETSSGCITNSLSDNLNKQFLGSEHWFCEYYGSLTFYEKPVFDITTRSTLIEKAFKFLLRSNSAIDVHIEINNSDFSISEKNLKKIYELNKIHHVCMRDFGEKQFLVVIFIDRTIISSQIIRFGCFKCVPPDGEEIVRWIQYLFNKSHAVFIEENYDRLMVLDNNEPSNDYNIEKITVKLNDKMERKYLGISIDLTGYGSIIASVYVCFIKTGSPIQKNRVFGNALDVGDILISCNGISFVGLSLEKSIEIIEKHLKFNRITLEFIKNSPISNVNFKKGKNPNDSLGFSLDDNAAISSIIRGSLAEINQLKLGNRIIEFNGIGTIQMSHIDLIKLITSSNSETFQIKTVPFHMFEIMTGIIESKII